MSTNSSIAIKCNDGTIKEIYCHWDGHLGWNGVKLLKFFNNFELVNELISMGDLSSLHENIHPIDNQSRDDVCEFYGRDRGEDNTEPQIYSSEDDYKKNGRHEQYRYLFKDNTWYVEFTNVREFVPLSAALWKFEKALARQLELEQ